MTVYLSQQAIADVLAYVAALPQGSSITFDYRVAPSLLHPIDQVIGEYAARQFGIEGEPWQSCFDPAELQVQVAALGFRQVRDFSPEVLNTRYCHRRKDGLRVGNGFRIMQAVV
jgi:O-methyltransferase involved in polyketide biosynthesis